MTKDKNEPEQKSNHRHLSRRQFLGLSAAGVAALALTGRTCFYEDPTSDAWSQAVLTDWEIAVLAAAAGALIPDSPTELRQASATSPSGLQVAQKVDTFLQGLPFTMLVEIHAMFGLIEHGTILNGSVLRFTRLSPPKRLAYLQRLNEMGSKFGDAFRGIRDLSLLGWYAHPKTWEPMGYDGPLLVRPAPQPVQTPQSAGKYARLIAPAGTRPKGTL
ncbi:twin-arginine translocation signal domain-containing protein [Bradymonas sediminis]|uniref:Uncharacterized protein n=1 Tax=Bradymonas sediminis TaxID=1548548 RepID=A0A2Z4FJ13_9DELT|nr:twin-arginine translocation signal domain-containing protein [Bradymonas sediminis]AWV88922.1 hypothetical protein DN745_06040 [Bradymonas sediminis]TDP71930.1 secreted protein [Bradymonas sediminis]